MSYASRRHIIHKDRYGTTHLIEIQQKDFGGSSQLIESSGFSFEHEEFLADSDSILKVYENLIQKGSLDVSVLIKNGTDFSLLEDIFESDEDEFRLVWKIDNTVFWT